MTEPVEFDGDNPGAIAAIAGDLYEGLAVMVRDRTDGQLVAVRRGMALAPLEGGGFDILSAAVLARRKREAA